MRTLGIPKEDEDGPTEETRAPAVDCNMVAQRQSRRGTMSPRWHRVRTLVAPREAHDDPS